MCVCFLVVASDALFAQTTVRVSLDGGGQQANGTSSDPSLSADGRVVAFVSSATNLVPGDTNALADVFVRDLGSGTTRRASVSSSGTQANAVSFSPALSGNGQVVAFGSLATNLVPDNANSAQDVYVHDFVSGTTSRASASSSGVEGNGDSFSPSLSADGRFVAFQSTATNLVVGDSNGSSDVFVRDMLTGVVSRVSVDSAGNQGNDASSKPSISAEGRYVAFRSEASNFASSTNGLLHIFVHDRLNGVTVLASQSNGGLAANGHCFSLHLAGNGRHVAFSSAASNLVSGDTNGGIDVFVRNLDAGTTTRVSLDYLGFQYNFGVAEFPTVSYDGTFIAFQGGSIDIMPGSTQNDWFRFDTVSDTLLRIGTGSGGLQGSSAPSIVVLASSGTAVGFASSASNVVPGDTNGVPDIFLSDLTGPPWVAYCFGDGMATPCPCGNASAPGAQAGCRNSLGTDGRLRATGTPSTSNDDFVLVCEGAGNGPMLYFQGTAQFANGFGAVLGDGLRCAGGTVIRLAIVQNTGGGSQYPRPGDPPTSVQGAVLPGTTRTYQGWYRDSAPFCTPETYNLTNGVALAWRP
jgi:Tol biopolymer transport system component